MKTNLNLCNLKAFQYPNQILKGNFTRGICGEPRESTRNPPSETRGISWIPEGISRVQREKFLATDTERFSAGIHQWKQTLEKYKCKRGHISKIQNLL